MTQIIGEEYPLTCDKMIPWMREKFAERKNRWQMTRKRDSVGSPSKKGQQQIDQQQQTSFSESPAPSPSKT